MGVTFQELPQEVLWQILLQLPAVDIPIIQRVCQKIHALCGPLLWRHCCRKQYQYWSRSRRIGEKLSNKVVQNDWKEIYAERYQIDRAISRTIDSILHNQVCRIEKTKHIVKFGYDAKDILLRHLNVPDGVEDVLARRWYTGAALSCLHRNTAIEQWLKLRRGEHVALEKALGAFDMFVIRDQEGDIDDISSSLDKIAKRFDEHNPKFSELDTRRKAISIANYLRAHDLVGISDNVENHYHDLQNNFIGIALKDDLHPSLPLITVAIYCCVAQRLGIDASPCAFPFHVLVIVRASNGQTLDSHDAAADSASESMYIDPFRSSTEIPVETLVSTLVSMGISHQSHETILGIAQTSEIVARCAGNIIRSAQTLPRGPDSAMIASRIPDMESATYAALWAVVLLPNDDDDERSLRLQARNLPVIIRHMEVQCPSDLWLIGKNVVPVVEPPERRQQVEDTLRTIRANDENPKKVKSRDSRASQNVHFRVGQVFQHKRYHYHAVITGWDVECAASDHWMSQMRVHDLPHGKRQSFYHALAEDKSLRYVAEENIEIVKIEPVAGLIAIAGQYFKRWDPHTKTFISNIRDEYPDD